MAKKKPANKAEREHMRRVADLGCIACIKMGYHGTPAEIHHIRTGMGMSQRNSHYNVIPLCFNHHSAQGGPDAIHKNKTLFESKFGSEQQLLEEVRELLGVCA